MIDHETANDIKHPMMIVHHICHKHVYIYIVKKWHSWNINMLIETWVKVSVVRPEVPAWLLPGQEAHAAQVSRRFSSVSPLPMMEGMQMFDWEVVESSGSHCKDTCEIMSRADWIQKVLYSKFLVLFMQRLKYLQISTAGELALALCSTLRKTKELLRAQIWSRRDKFVTVTGLVWCWWFCESIVMQKDKPRFDLTWKAVLRLNPLSLGDPDILSNDWFVAFPGCALDECRPICRENLHSMLSLAFPYLPVSPCAAHQTLYQKWWLRWRMECRGSSIYDIRNSSIATTSCLETTSWCSWIWWLEYRECTQDSSNSFSMGTVLVHWPLFDLLCWFLFWDLVLGSRTAAISRGKSCFAVTRAGMHFIMCSGSFLVVGNWTWNARMFCACVFFDDPDHTLSEEPLAHRYGNGTDRCLGCTNPFCSIEELGCRRVCCRNVAASTSTPTMADEPFAPRILSRFCRRMFQGWKGYHN